MGDLRWKLLVIEDDDLVVSSIRMATPSQWRTVHSSDPTKVPSGTFAAALVDMHLSGHSNKAEGVALIEKLHNDNPHLEIIAMSGNLDRNLMENCLKAGASRFLAKPLTSEELRLTLDKIEAMLLMRDASIRASSIGPQVNWVGSSTSSTKIKREIASLRGEPGPILIEGESGTGKEVVATLVHRQEGVGRPFVCVNLAGLPDNLFESEFFGHVRGAFTGADQNKMGLSEAAHGGDLFLDELEALPLTSQAKLLRFLENGEVRRVGAKDSLKVQVRIIAATNQNLDSLVKEGKFREDLLWRLNGRKILLPPLRSRVEDIAELSRSFLENEKPRRNKSMDSDAIETMKNHSWPGNVRELKRICEQLCLHSPLPVIRSEDVIRFLSTEISSEPVQKPNLDLSIGLAELMNSYEADILRLAIDRTKDIDQSANLLKLSRSTLYKKLKDYNIDTRSTS